METDDSCIGHTHWYSPASVGRGSRRSLRGRATIPQCSLRHHALPTRGGQLRRVAPAQRTYALPRTQTLQHPATLQTHSHTTRKHSNACHKGDGDRQHFPDMIRAPAPILAIPRATRNRWGRIDRESGGRARGSQYQTNRAHKNPLKHVCSSCLFNRNVQSQAAG